MEERELDMYACLETWEKEGDEEVMKSNIRELDREREWDYISKRRKMRKNTERRGSGGVSCFLRKKPGRTATVVKESEYEGLLWIRIREEGKTDIYVGIIYLVQSTARRKSMAVDAIEELDRDVSELSTNLGVPLDTGKSVK